MPATPARHVPGPAALGRGAVVAANALTPPLWRDAPRLRIDAAVLAAPTAAATVLYRHWARRQPYVVELAVANDDLRAPQLTDAAPHHLPADFVFQRERLHFLVWANTYDCRGDAPIWWHGELARRRGAEPSDRADVRVPAPRGDHVDVWVDGGPRGPVGDLALVHRESVALGRLTLAGTAPPNADLAPDQLAAVAHTSGPARVIAPAGSGKTRVLVARLRHLLADRRVEPELVTAVAYNNRAAAELRERLADDPATAGANVRTIHSLALGICRSAGRVDVIDEREVRRILDRIVRVPRIPNQDPMQPYLEALSEVRLGLRDPDRVELERDDVDSLADALDAYRTELGRRNAVDFDEQIYRAIELLLGRPDLRRATQRRCTHLLVDEFQDLTPAYLLLLRLAAGPPAQVFAVGDDDQVIYSHAGATPTYLVDFDRFFPAAAHHALEVNYRCPAPVVDGARTLLTHNRVRVEKTIRASQTAAATVPSIRRVPSDRLASRLVEVVAAWLDGGVAPRTIVVLTRVNSALLPAQVGLLEAGLPTTTPLDASVLGRTGIRTALAYLRLGLDPERMRREDLGDTLRRPSRKLVGAVSPLLRRSGTWSLDRLAALEQQLSGRYADRLGDYVADLRRLSHAITAGADTRACLRIIRDEIGLGSAMTSLDASRSRPEGSAHGDDLDALEQLAVLREDPATFRPWLVERLRQRGEADGVALSTVHRVKGREWDRVVVFAANAGLFPHRLATDHEEERRVLHVAVTRCRQAVVVLADRAAPSPFLDELDRPAASPATGAPGLRAASAPTASPPRPAAAPTSRRPQVTAGQVVAEAGIGVGLPGGFTGRIVAVESPAVIVDLGDGLRMTLRLGDPVEIDGQPATLVAAPARRPTAAEATDAASDALFDELRAWRSRESSARGVPAYVILHDAHLRAIAAARPQDLRELAACPGIGAAKLERYGDDLLEVIDAAGAG